MERVSDRLAQVVRVPDPGPGVVGVYHRATRCRSARRRGRDIDLRHRRQPRRREPECLGCPAAGFERRAESDAPAAAGAPAELRGHRLAARRRRRRGPRRRPRGLAEVAGRIPTARSRCSHTCSARPTRSAAPTSSRPRRPMHPPTHSPLSSRRNWLLAPGAQLPDLPEERAPRRARSSGEAAAGPTAGQASRSPGSISPRQRRLIGACWPDWP